MALMAFLVTTLALTACSGWRTSRANPSNWFGSSRTMETTAPAEDANPLIPQRSAISSRPGDAYIGVLIQEITDLRIERDPSGAIIYAEGIAARQGAYDARLIPENEDLTPDENGVLTYRFEVLYPEHPTSVGSEQMRRIIIATDLSVQALEAVRTIRVEAATNARESRRR